MTAEGLLCSVNFSKNLIYIAKYSKGFNSALTEGEGFASNLRYFNISLIQLYDRDRSIITAACHAIFLQGIRTAFAVFTLFSLTSIFIFFARGKGVKCIVKHYL